MFMQQRVKTKITKGGYQNEKKKTLYRKSLWRLRNNRTKRWIRGEKFNGSDYTGIERALEWQRKLNKIAGFSSDKKNWHQYEYENQMRDLKNAKKMQKVLTKF